MILHGSVAIRRIDCTWSLNVPCTYLLGVRLGLMANHEDSHLVFEDKQSTCRLKNHFTFQVFVS